MQGWTFNGGQNGQDVSGGQGTYVTVEASYPYILLTQADASKICALSLALRLDSTKI